MLHSGLSRTIQAAVEKITRELPRGRAVSSRAGVICDLWRGSCRTVGIWIERENKPFTEFLVRLLAYTGPEPGSFVNDVNERLGERNRYESAGTSTPE